LAIKIFRKTKRKSDYDLLMAIILW